jgi:hypothetical protein
MFELDKIDRRSVYNIVPTSIQKVIDQCDPADFDMTEKELRMKYDPDHFVQRLRIAFWREFDHAQHELRDISVLNIAQMMGTPTSTVLSNMKQPHNLAWILCVPAGYDIIIAEAEARGFGRLREILDIDIFNPDGTVNHKSADLLLKAIAFVDARKNGAIVQKSLHVHSSTREAKQFASNLTVEQLDEKIKELESRSVIKQAKDAVIDV